MFSKYSYFSIVLLFLGLLSVLLITSCNRESILKQGGFVTYSIDTLTFDTVFTAQGSSTREILIYNKQKEKIILNSVRIGKGEHSPFYMNINGNSEKEIKDIEINANDSLWVFVGVNVDPTDEDAPFVQTDELISELNGRTFTLPLMAYGQNAIYIVDSVLETQTWKKGKPYVVIHSALVQEGHTLTIEQGTSVYMHADSRLYVLGSLQINGTKSDSVIFQGDRLDRKIHPGDYFGLPGEWGGIYIAEQSKNNLINYAIFKDGGASTKIGEGATLAATIQVDKDNFASPEPKLKITNSIIRNSVGYGIIAFSSSIVAENCLIVECAYENIALIRGGNYQFYDCTIASFGWRFLNTSDHYTFTATNYFVNANNEVEVYPLNAKIENCIIYGGLENEVFFDRVADESAELLLSHCLIKSTDTIPSFITSKNNIFNINPKFINRAEWDYHLLDSSPAVNTGVDVGNISTDLDGIIRKNPPTIGCYELAE